MRTIHVATPPTPTESYLTFSPPAQCHHVHCVYWSNGKEELKVKDRLPPEITIHHLHLISHHMVVRTFVTAQVEIFIFIIL